MMPGAPANDQRTPAAADGARAVFPATGICFKVSAMSDAPNLAALDEEPYYLPLADEVEVFAAAYAARLPVLLKGPTGCGKTRFVEHMAWRLYRADHAKEVAVPLVTISCHEDLTATDMVGRFLLQGDETVWSDGPLTRAVRSGAICYLDEIVEARKDTTVLIHSLTDHRRLLPIDKTGELLTAHPDFLLVISYNPGYQSVLKDLKPSTRQRFVSLTFDYPDREREAAIIAHESGVDAAAAERLAVIGEKVRNLRDHGFEEGVSTRLLVYAGELMGRGVTARRAAEIAVVQAVSDDATVQQAIGDIVDAVLP
jgi:nitric oxide reductase NorQ protein